jgi:hypothetical protein
MDSTLVALFVLVAVASATFYLFWLIDRRNARARIIEERLTAEEELGASSLLRRSARDSDLQVGRIPLACANRARQVPTDFPQGERVQIIP